MNPLLPLALLGLGLGFAEHQTSRFERAAAAEISSKLSGDERQVSVDAVPDAFRADIGGLESATVSASHFTLRELPFFTEPWRSQKAPLDLLRLRLSDFEMKGLHIAELSADIPDCRYDFGLARKEKTFRISKSGEGTGWVKILEADLAAYIVRRFAEIKSCTVRVANDVLWVEGYGEFLIVQTNFAVIAHLRAVDGVRLELTDAKVYFDWVRAEPAAAKVILDVLNPVVDLDRGLGLYDAIFVDEIRLRDGVLWAGGKTRVPIKPGG